MTKLTHAWKKSSHSGSDNCLEARITDTGDIQVRDSKHPDGPVLAFIRAEWNAFIGGTKSDEFSL